MAEEPLRGASRWEAASLYSARRGWVSVAWVAALLALASSAAAQPTPGEVPSRTEGTEPGATDDEAPSDAETAPADDGESAPPVEEGATGPTEGTEEPAAEAAAESDDSVVVDSSVSLFEDEPSSDAPIDAPADPGAPASAHPGASGGATQSAPKFDLGGYVRGDVFVGQVPGRGQGDIKAAYGELGLDLRARGGKLGDGFAELRFRHGLQGAEQQLFTDLREAYVNAYLGPLDLRVGHQIIVWGRADGFNPTNNITPFDLRIRSPLEDDRRLANTGVRAFLNFAPLRLEGVWMPLYRATEPPELPPAEIPGFVRFADPQYPDPEVQNGLIAGRLHLLLAELEMSVSYLNGYSPLPGLHPAAITGDDANPPEFFVARRAYRQQVFGFDFSTAIGELLALRGEAAYRRPFAYEERAYAPRPDVQYVLGVDRSFGPVSVIAQYIGRYTLDWEEERSGADAEDIELVEEFTSFDPALYDQVMPQFEQELAARNQMLFSQLAEVQHLASLRLEWRALHDTLSLSLLGLGNLTTEEWLLYPKLSYSISDRMSTSLGGELYGGPSGTLFGFIGETLSAGYVELRYSF